MDNAYLVRIPNGYPKGKHGDVYVDFENEILRYTKWKSINGSTYIIRRIFEKFYLPKLEYRTFNFNLPTLNRNRIVFASLSGIEYVKIFQHYLFQSRLKAIYQFDTWTHDNTINENAFRSFKINLAFMSIREASEYFNSLNIPNFKAHWIPEAINSESYKFSDVDGKNIDILQYGRRWEWLHDQILTFCKIYKMNYMYPKEIGSVKHQFKDRDELLDVLSRTKVAICVPKTITHPEIYDLPAVTTRYFECMASKCLILGHAPEDLIKLFEYNPIIEVDYSAPLDQFAYLLDHYIEYIPLIERNYQITKEKHQWHNRITDIKNIIDAKNNGFKGKQ
jgi:hypothetical protein